MDLSQAAHLRVDIERPFPASSAAESTGVKKVLAMKKKKKRRGTRPLEKKFDIPICIMIFKMNRKK